MAKSNGDSSPDPVAKLAAPERVAAFRTGLSAESRAAAYLMAKGYRILAKRFRTPYGEIDLVGKELAQSGAHHGMVVDDGNADHGRVEVMAPDDPTFRRSVT